ncbi:MAG TPA: prepilin-type N-terminal cleavage/methylation domain-containing protein [Candidatus Sulfomarinibacteraceae bacterium]|nr:prepilin-type N-terminal cleavage/methylation domain-containing protein [Candidatus Sulfomarinibacteraceae bacterium]
MERAACPVPRRDQGFTLVEVLMALLILAIVALGIAGMFSHSMLVNASGYDYAKLASQARFVLEELRARPFDDPTLVATGGTPRTWTPVGGVTYSNRGFTATYTVNDFSVDDWTDLAGGWTAPGATAGNVKRITVTVASTTETLQGNRVLTVSAVKVAG